MTALLVDILPVSRCALHLRDAGFTTIVESTLGECLDFDTAGQSTPILDEQVVHASESSETVHEEQRPSRKRKRGSSGASTPSKRAATAGGRFSELFSALITALRTVKNKASTLGSSNDTMQAEHMKMALRTESAQAARILKYYLNALRRLTTADTLQSGNYLDLTLAVEIWELRTVDAKNDNREAIEQFCTECMVPVLHLSQTLRQHAVAMRESEAPHPELRAALLALDRLLVSQVLLPSRTDFFSVVSRETVQDLLVKRPQATLFSSCIESLRAELVQAAQIEDLDQPVPIDFSLLFAAVPYVLDLVIRTSPARTLKSRIAEKPWIQASFIALAEAAGCALKEPRFAAPNGSIVALEQSLQVITSHHVSIDLNILRDLFWYHSGLQFPTSQKRVPQWQLVTALIKLDPSIFLSDPRWTRYRSQDKPDDLAMFLFDHIPPVEPYNDNLATKQNEPAIKLGQRDAVEKIIIPIMSAFARNRDLLGFMNRWDQQLCKSLSINRHKSAEHDPTVWEDHRLSLALSDLFEVCLTFAQISSLFEDHAKRLESEIIIGGPLEKALSSAIIGRAMLQAVKSDELTAFLQPQLRSLWKSYSLWVQSDPAVSDTAFSTAWMALCQLLVSLWPIDLHASNTIQQELLFPLIETARKVTTSRRKSKTDREVSSRSRATASIFSLIACDCLRSLPDARDLARKTLRRALKTIRSTGLNGELSEVTGLFCSEFTQLLDLLEADTCRASIDDLLSTISGFDRDVGDQMAKAFSEAVFVHGTSTLLEAYTTALSEALARNDERLYSIAVICLSEARPLSIPREQREALLDCIEISVSSRPDHVAALLGIMVHLMEVPNATAKISSDGTGFSGLAQRLHEAGQDSPVVLKLLQSLVRLTLGHIIPNKDQPQNKLFVEDYVHTITKKAKRWFPAKLALLRGTVLATHQEHTLIPVEQYVTLLTTCLNSGSIPEQYVLQAFNEIPWQSLHGNSGAFSSAQDAVLTWSTKLLPLQRLSEPFDETLLKLFPVEFWPTIHRTFAIYHLYPHWEWLLGLSLAVLSGALSAKERMYILESARTTLLPIDPQEKLSLCPALLSVRHDQQAHGCRLLDVLISTLEDRQEIDTRIKEQQLALLPKICSLLGESSDELTFNALLDCINTVIRDKPSFINQHSMECVLSVLLKVASRNSPRLPINHAPVIFQRICETTRLTVLLHRGRLGGRFHLLLPLLQSLLLCLFIPNAGRGAALPPWLETTFGSARVRLTQVNASQYGRLISTLCSPTQSSVQRPTHSSRAQTSKSKRDLNDPVKAAREYASHYLFSLLSSFCRYHLNGRLEPDVREKLMPAIWEMIGVSTLDRPSLDAMFAGLARSEKEVWTGLWAEWERVNGRREDTKAAS